MATTTFSIRLTHDQLVALKAAAGEQGASLFAREAVLAAVEGRRRTRRQRERDQLHRSLALVQATLICLVDRIGLGQPCPLDTIERQLPDAAEIALLRMEIHTLVGAVLRLGRRLDEADGT